MTQDISSRIAEARAHQRLSLEQVAEKAQISVEELTALEADYDRVAAILEDEESDEDEIAKAEKELATLGAAGFFCAVDIDPAAFGHLQFSWRVQDVPTQANVAAAEHDDCPARIIVAFAGDDTRLPLRDPQHRLRHLNDPQMPTTSTKAAQPRCAACGSGTSSAWTWPATCTCRTH